ncbi:MAG: 50S ribosomal protein L25, partial [Microgenomates group bacterium]
FDTILSMAKLTLNAQKRVTLGRKVKNLRKQGLLPANVYGKKIKSQAVSLNQDEFRKIYDLAGETEVVDLKIEGEKESRPILIQNLQTHPVSGLPLHVDLRQIILTEKITAKIPVEITGESPAAEQKLGILIQTVSELEVEALPMDLPEKFVVDVSQLTKVGDEIKVKDLAVDKKVELKAEDDLIVAKIEPLAAEEVAPPPPAEEVPVEAEAPETKVGEQPAGEETASKKETATKEEKSE